MDGVVKLAMEFVLIMHLDKKKLIVFIISQ